MRDKAGSEARGAERTISRRTLLGAVAGLVAAQALPVWLIGPNMAYALDYWWWDFGHRDRDWGYPDDDGYYRGFSYKEGFAGQSADVGPNGTRYRELWVAVGVEAYCDWRTELYYHFRTMAFNRCGAHNVITGYERGKGHGWVRRGFDQYIDIALSYGQKDDSGLTNVSEALCDQGDAYRLYSDMATSYGSNDPADSGWYHSIDEQIGNANQSFAFTLRRKRDDLGVVLSADQVVYGFTHERFYMVGRDFHSRGDVGIMMRGHVLVNALSGISGIYKVISCADSSFALTSDRTGSDCGATTVCSYRAETAQNWYVDRSPADLELSRLRSVANPGQENALEQYGARPDEDARVVTYPPNPGMGQQWWFHAIAPGSPQDMNGYGARGDVYQLFCNCSGRSLAISDGGAPREDQPVQVYRDSYSGWQHADHYWQVVPVVFEGSVSLSVEGDSSASPTSGKRIVCSNPYDSCAPVDRGKSGSVEYWYTWYVSETPDGPKAEVRQEYCCDTAEHDVQAELELDGDVAGRFVHVRVRLRMNCGVFYDGEVWASFECGSEPKQVRYHLDDPQSVWMTATVADGRDAYEVDGEITRLARKANCHHVSGEQGFDGWYSDAEYTKLYEARPIEGDVLDLYGRNWTTVTYANGRSSDIADVFTAQGMTGTLDYVSGMPAAFEKPYGTYVALAEPVRTRVSYQGDAWFPLTLRARVGWYASWECSGAAFQSLEVRGDTTVYKAWDASAYDGVVSNGG